jgi:repressor LexA
VRVLPLLGQIAAGSPILADENVEDMLAVPESLTASGENFILRVRGDSMVDDGILDGDFVIVRRQDDAVDGEIVAALVGGDEATVKRIYREAGHVRLQPANESMQPIVLDAGEVAVAGKVVGVFRRL